MTNFAPEPSASPPTSPLPAAHSPAQQSIHFPNQPAVSSRHLEPTVSRLSNASPSSPLSRIRSSHQTASSIAEDPEQPRPPRPPSPPGAEANAPPLTEEVTRLRLTAHYAGLVLAAMIGTLIRLGLEALATYDGMVIFALAWSQGVGCGIMGLALGGKNAIIEVYPPFYTFLTTGTAGSITTFSSWMLEGYGAFANIGDYSRSGLHDTVDGLAYSFSTWAIALASLHFGDRLSKLIPQVPYPPFQLRGILLPPKGSSTSSPTPPSDEKPRLSPFSSRKPLLDILTISTAVLSYLIALLLYFLGPPAWRHRATFAILLAPPGAILRFALSKINPRQPFVDRFPIGTFLSNTIATLVIAGVYVAQRRPSAQGTAVRCDALYAVEQGFCGCLSTVSTFVVESRAIKTARWKWGYVLGSVILGHLLVLAIVGGVKWDRGLLPSCNG